jgi:predicted transcriptional regulator
VHHLASERIMPTKKKTVSVRLDPKLAKRLDTLAKDSGRSVSWQINRLVEDNIDYLEYAIAAINEGLEDIRAGRTHDAEVVINEMLAALKLKERPRARRAG